MGWPFVEPKLRVELAKSLDLLPKKDDAGGLPAGVVENPVNDEGGGPAGVVEGCGVTWDRR